MKADQADHFPVLIVGGGASGLLLSALLSRQGVRSLLVERNSTTCDHPQAHVVNTRSMEIFRSLGLDSEIRRHALPMGTSHVRWVTDLAGRQLAALNLAPPPKEIVLRMAQSPAPQASCAQDRIEPLLANLAAKGPGRVEFSTEMVDLETAPDGVTVKLRHGGKERVVHADWVVACDGAASPTRSLLGIAMEGPEALAHVVGIYFHADLSEFASARPAILYWTIDTEAPGTLIAIDGKERWVFHAAWDVERLSLESYTKEQCKRILRRAIGADVDFDIRSVRPWTMAAQVAERYRAGRVLLAGDAAHRFPPTGGFGMNTGLQDVHNLAWKLAAVIEGKAGSVLLDSYESERLPVGRGNCDWSARNAAGLDKVIGPGAAHEAQRLADGAVSFEALSAQIQEIADREVGHFSALGRDLGFSYETGALVPDSSQPPEREDPDRDYIPNARPGARAPHHGFVKEGKILSTLDLFDGQWTLLAGAAETEHWRSAAAAQGLPIAFVGVGVDVEDPSGGFASLYGIDAGAVLVRPDGHVAWRCRDGVDDPGATLRHALAKILGNP